MLSVKLQTHKSSWSSAVCDGSSSSFAFKGTQEQCMFAHPQK